jgi:hypothetical protein
MCSAYRCSGLAFYGLFLSGVPTPATKRSGGDFANVEEWDAYLGRFAERLRSPVKVTVAAE